MRIVSTAVLVALGFSGSPSFATPKTYKFAGTLTQSWGGSSPPAEWAFAAGQKFSGEFVYDAVAISSSYDYISNPDWTLTFHDSPLVSLKFAIDTPGEDYVYVVPTQDLTNTAWQYVAIGKSTGTEGWTGVELRTHNYPEGWYSGPPSAPVPPSAYVGPYNPHMVDISFINSIFYNSDAPSLLPNTSADVDLAALHSGLIGPETNTQFTVRFSDSYAWTTPGTERLQAIIYGRIDSLWATTSPVPEPASWAMMIFGFAMVGSMMRRPSKMTVRLAA